VNHRLLACLLLPLLGASCYASRLEQRADVLDYLYPPEHPDEPAGPVRLELPLRVGIAFVPASEARGDQYAVGGHFSGSDVASVPTMDETQRFELLARIRDSFDAVDGVERIEIVPSAYLRPQGGFAQLDQIRGLLGVDLVALVSYEQVQYGAVDERSLAYYTVIGGAFVEGNENETTTFVTTSVFDVRSRALLFHASGASRVEEDATPLELELEMRGDSRRGFVRAVDDMIGELDGALASFQEEVKSGSVRGGGLPGLEVTARPGYEGAGAAGAVEIVLGLAVLGAAAARRWRKDP
jgi:rhombotail lipoprotein